MPKLNMILLKRKIKSCKYYLLITSISISLSGCTTQETQSLKIKANPIDAQLSGNILSGANVLNDPDRFVWGASVVEGDDGKYHMLYATWECGENFPEFSNSWILFSKIAYAVSDYPDKNFVFQKIVLRGRGLDGDSTAWDAVSVHNPHVKRFDNKYYLYYTGSKDPGIQAPGSKGANVNKRNRVQQYQRIGVIEFKHFADLLSGNFKRPDEPILSPRTRVKLDDIVEPSVEGTEPKPDNIIVVNPSVVRRPSDGKYLLYFKGNIYNPYWRGVHGVAIADSPAGPFQATDHFVFDIKMEDGKIASAEDPFVWFHRVYEKFFVVFKDFSGRITEGKPGLAILESFDGINWTKPAEPFFMKKEVILKSGDAIKVSNLERPQLLIDNEGNPKVLYAACSLGPVGKKTDGSTFNVHISLTKVDY